MTRRGIFFVESIVQVIAGLPLGIISGKEDMTMVHTKAKSGSGSRPLCFYLAPEVAEKLAEIAVNEGRPFYKQAAKFIEDGVAAHNEARKPAS